MQRFDARQQREDRVLGAGAAQLRHVCRSRSARLTAPAPSDDPRRRPGGESSRKTRSTGILSTAWKSIGWVSRAK
jgi:hypothetical protein